MTLVRPSAVLTLDGQRLSSAEGAALRVRVRLGLGPAHDAVEVFCWPSSKLASAAIGSALAVALGSAGSEADVFSGEVAAVRLTPDGVALEALAGSIALSRSFVSQSYISLSIADIVQQLASAAGVDVADASASTTLSAYAVDNRRSVWAHLNELAALSGADITFTEAGALKFVAPAAAGPGSALGGAISDVSALLLGGASGLRFGANVLDWRAITRDTAPAASVAAYGAASESGSEKWHWIRRDPKSEGSGPMRVAGAFHTRDAASALADALSARGKRATRRTAVTVVGDASWRPGGTTTVAGLPGDAGGDLRIVAVEHTLDGDRGWVTRLTLELAA